MIKTYDIREEKGIKDILFYVKDYNVNVESFETKILLEESIDSVLKFRFIYENEKRTLLYDVSDTISIEEYLEQKKLSKIDICDILDQINEVLSSMENYLIEEGSLSLDMKMVRVMKNNSNRISLKFMILPDYKSDFSYELSKFLIKVLRYVDIKDKDALILAYSLFVRSSKENYTISDLMELVDSALGNRFEALRKMEKEALNAYDEELAIEAKENLVGDNEIIYDTSEFESEKDSIESDISDVDLSINDSSKNEIIMDNSTKAIINDELFDSFNDTESNANNKVVKFKKKIFNIGLKKALNGHISFDKTTFLILPLFLMIVPIVLYYIFNQEKFLKYIILICVYEFIVVSIFTIRNVKRI